MNPTDKLPAWCPAAPNFEVDADAIVRFVEQVAPVASLVATPQDARHHAEGDVWTHTQMVAHSLTEDGFWRALDGPLRAVVFASALLHDVGKPGTTRIEDGRLTSRGHSRRGEGLARVALWRAGMPFAVREHICRLVRHHQVPFFALDRADAESHALRLSLELRLDALAILAIADARGRRCAVPGERERLMEAVSLWREFCSELGVLARPRRFATAHTRVVWLEDLEAHGRTTRHPDLAAHDDTGADVLVMSGLPGSGKDTWLRNQRPDLPVVSLDGIRTQLGLAPGETNGRVIATARDAARGYLRTGTSFAWNATNVSRRIRSQVVRLCRDYRARVTIIYVETGCAERARRNAGRPHVVPAAAIERMLEQWSVPGPDEAHDVKYVIDGRGTGQDWPPGE